MVKWIEQGWGGIVDISDILSIDLIPLIINTLDSQCENFPFWKLSNNRGYWYFRIHTVNFGAIIYSKCTWLLCTSWLRGFSNLLLTTLFLSSCCWIGLAIRLLDADVGLSGWNRLVTVGLTTGPGWSLKGILNLNLFRKSRDKKICGYLLAKVDEI